MWFLSTRPVESQGVGRTQSTLWDQTLSALTHSGCCHWILISKTKTNPPSLGNLQKWDCFVRYGTRGISTDCASKNSSVAEGLPAPVWKPAHPWQAFGCISNGYCFRAATDQDRQTVFPLGLAPVRFSPLQSVFAESYLQCQGKNNFKKKKQHNKSFTAHTLNYLEGNLKAFFWVTHASLSLLILPLLIMIFNIKIS